MPFEVDRVDQLDELPLHTITVSVNDPTQVSVKIGRGVLDVENPIRTAHDQWATTDGYYGSIYGSHEIAQWDGPQRVVWVVPT